jgi:hypothetical protein
VKRRVSLFLGLLFFVSLTAWAQDTATIVGAVLDSTGAVIPGAKVTVDNAAKGFHRDLVASAAGEYAAVRIPLGDYVITAEAPGFQKLVRSGITVAVGQTLRVDLQLTVGQVTQEVTVTGNITRVETETAAISDVVTGTQISNLELNGRNFVLLAMLVPGANLQNGTNTTQVGVYGGLGISFNGGRTQYNNWEIDSGPNTDEGSAGTLNTYPSLDTIGEFRISTSNYGADMGKHAGATIEVATKAGTKDFHGSVFDYVRNDKFDANPWFINRGAIGKANAPKTPRKWNDYGYNIGGPFYIPGVYNTDKSKTFFFWSENWRKYREGTVIGGSHNVPSLRMRNGDFTECDPASANYVDSIYKAGCRIPKWGGVSYNTVQAMVAANPELDPLGHNFTNGQILLDGLVPKPNSGLDGWILSSSTPTNWRQEQIRVDHNIGEKTRVFVRYTQDAWDTLTVPALWTGSSYDTIKTPFGGPGKSAVLNIAHSFKPNLMNEFMMGYTVDHILLYNQVAPSSVAGSIEKPANWTTKNIFAANAGNPLLPGIVIGSGNSNFGATVTAGNHPWFNSNPIITWKDNMAWTVGRQTLKFGFFLEKYRKNEQYGSPTQGTMNFNTGASNTTGNPLADMLTGRIQSYNEGTTQQFGRLVGGYPKGHWRMTAFEPYFQDDWKLSRKLTLNIGVRYYLFTRIHDVTRPTIDAAFIPALYDPRFEKLLDSGAKFDNSVAALAAGYTHDFTTFGNGLVECGTGAILKGCQTPYYWNIAPRFGFAYDPWGNGKTVIRGGYGIYYEMGNGNEAQTEGIEGNPPANLAPSLTNLDGYDQIKSISSFAEAAAYGPPGIQTIPYRQKWGSVSQFSFGIQHEFRGNNVLGVSYVGSLGRHLARNRNLNQIPIGVDTVNVAALAGFVGTDKVDPTNTTPMCDAAGNCDVQRILMSNQKTNLFFLPYRGYGTIGVKENTSVASYNSLQVNFRHVVGHGLTFQAAYTWAKGIDDSSSTYSSSPNSVDDYNLSRWRAISDMNRAHMLMLNYVYDLPFFKNSSGPVKSILGGWTISGITSFMTGQPVNFTCGVSGYSTGIGGSVRCNALGELKIKKGVVDDPTYGPTPTWYDPAVVGQVTLDQLRADGQPGMFGTMGRNALIGPGRNNWDLALLKNFELPWFKGEHSTIQFRWETFNSFNHPQFRAISAGCAGSIGFGQPCVTGTRGQVTTAWDPRIMQLGLKFLF